ncbi:MAG: alpha/beta fold hydrolase, partial [Janthinobacterium lividum]
SKTDLDQYKAAWQNPATLRTMINWYRAYKYSKLALKRINVQTLILWGKKDTFLLPGMAEKSNLMCAKGKLIVLEDLSHWLHHEKPAQVNQLILNFIS